MYILDNLKRNYLICIVLVAITIVGVFALVGFVPGLLVSILSGAVTLVIYALSQMHSINKRLLSGAAED